MDMTKAFDMVEWSDLFDTLRKRGVSAISIRLLLFIYQNQHCNVRWAGVRQGALSSAISFSVYIDELITILRHSEFGCYVIGIILGCFGYADCLFLISASRIGLQAKVKLCQKFAERKKSQVKYQLWDIFSSEFERLYKSWNVSMRLALNVDRCAHHYLIESISGATHPKVMLSSRYASFWRSLRKSAKLPLRLLARLFEKDGRTLMGRTINSLCRQCKLEDIENLTADLVKKKSEYFRALDNEQWRLGLVTELLQLRIETMERHGFTSNEIKDMIHFTCTS